MNPLYALVADRAQHRCEYCLAPEAIFNLPFEVEHILPVSKGGANAESNLALACRSCNLRKSDRITGIDPETEATAPLFHPRQDDWNTHFQVNRQSGKILGQTPTGRVTVTLLALNSPLQLSARLLWMSLKMFP
jgi:hypothetical protein